MSTCKNAGEGCRGGGDGKEEGRTKGLSPARGNKRSDERSDERYVVSYVGWTLCCCRFAQANLRSSHPYFDLDLLRLVGWDIVEVRRRERRHSFEESVGEASGGRNGFGHAVLAPMITALGASGGVGISRRDLRTWIALLGPQRAL